MLASREEAAKVPSVLKTTRATLVTKPFMPEDLIKSVKKVCKKGRKKPAVSAAAKKKAPAKKKTSASKTKAKSKTKAATKKTSRRKKTRK